jgi:hypothetical protein
MFASQTSPSLSPSSASSSLCVLSFSAFSSLSSSCSGGSSDPFPSPISHASASLFSLFSKIRQKLNPSFSQSSALFQKECSHNSFLINSFRTFSQNAGGRSLILQAKLLSHPAFTPISLRITFFAHPHLLTPIESHSCKNRGGVGCGLRHWLCTIRNTPATATPIPSSTSAHFPSHPGVGGHPPPLDPSQFPVSIFEFRSLSSPRDTDHRSRVTCFKTPWNNCPSPTSSQVRR